MLGQVILREVKVAHGSWKIEYNLRLLNCLGQFSKSLKTFEIVLKCCERHLKQAMLHSVELLNSSLDLLSIVSTWGSYHTINVNGDRKRHFTSGFVAVEVDDPSVVALSQELFSRESTSRTAAKVLYRTDRIALEGHAGTT